MMNHAIQKTTNTVVRIMLDWTPNTNHIGLYVAKKQGYFSKRNLSVEILPVGMLPTGEYHCTSVGLMVGAGKADFGFSFQESFTLAQAKKQSSNVAVAAVIQHNTSGYASLATANIRTPKDWIGKKCGACVCVSPIQEETMMTDLLASYGHTAHDVTFVPVRDLYFLPGLQQGIYDFAWIFEGWEGVEASIDGVALQYTPLRDMNPVFDYYTPVLITSEAYLKNNNATARKFVQAIKEGYEWAIAHPEGAALTLYEYENTLDLAFLKKSMEYLAPRFQDDAKEWGMMNDAVWKRYTKWMQDKGLVSSSFSIEGAFTNEFVNQE